MNDFISFDPLKAKSIADTDVAALAQKREIKNILSSYVGWFDPFCELIQNSLDAIEERSKISSKDNYIPTIWITISIKDNSLIVSDNGIGLDEEKFKQFLCPDISFKSGETRGHKGVGATYLAYGFNQMQVSTKTPDFSVVGKMKNARNWLGDENPSGNPKIRPDNSLSADEYFNGVDRGVSIYLKFDISTHPKDLKWVQASNAESWFEILSVKTGLGAFIENSKILVNVKVIDRDNNISEYSHDGIRYFWPHLANLRTASVNEITKKEEELFKKKGPNYTLPSKFKNLDIIFQKWDFNEILSLANERRLKLNNEEIEIINKFKPGIYVAYAYSLKVWDSINNSLNVRSSYKIIYGGIQIAANNMPQGGTIQIPLTRNIGRQNQIHYVIHFNNCAPDLGRKGFQSDIVDFAKDISRKISDGPLLKIKHALRTNTGSAPNLMREKKVEDWKKEMEDHENQNPLVLVNENFFLPSKKISITSSPTREQDVIALFNQLLAGGVIRGLKIMATNERFTYDGLCRVIIEVPQEHHIYDKTNNPLGLDNSIIEDFDLPFNSAPQIIEYKYSLDGLIEDIDNGTKNSNDISLIVVWETGELYRRNYHITSLLDPDNLTQREYHGITHTVTNLNTNQKEMDLIVLSELIEFLADQENAIKCQIKKYEE